VHGGVSEFDGGGPPSTPAGVMHDFSAIAGFVPWVYEQNRLHFEWT